MGTTRSHSRVRDRRVARRHATRWVATLLLAALAGCSYRALGLAPPEIDPKATFAAYRTHDGLAIARAEGGLTGTIDAAGWSELAPAYRVALGGNPQSHPALDLGDRAGNQKPSLTPRPESFFMYRWE